MLQGNVPLRHLLKAKPPFIHVLPEICHQRSKWLGPKISSLVTPIPVNISFHCIRPLTMEYFRVRYGFFEPFPDFFFFFLSFFPLTNERPQHPFLDGFPSYHFLSEITFFTCVSTYLLPGVCIYSLEHLEDFCWIRFSLLKVKV